MQSKTRRAHTEATKAKIRATCLRRVFSQEVKERIARANIRANGKPVKCIETGIEYESESEAARKLSVSVTSISRVCHGERNTVRGLTLRFKSE